MTTALYRRYRPDTFDQVIGQDHVTGPLRAALRANKVTHAYLFSGPRGCGKTTSARILARCLNCAEGPTDTPCGQCDSCRELATGGPGSLDVVEIDAASHGGVDDARDLRERATFAPVRDRYKVFIIDEAHMVSTQGFNALLKLVEEPPEHVKFVFATTEPDRVIGTIRSRTHHYPFRLVPPDVLEPYLQTICEEEHIGVGDGVLGLVVRAGGGSVRDTLSVLDQLMAGSPDGTLDYHRTVALLGYTDSALLDQTVDALAGGDGAAVYRVVERMVESGHDPRRFVEDLLQRLRDLLIISVAGDGARDVLAGTPADQLERMEVQARNWGPRPISRAADLTDEALRSMTGATSPRLQLELLLGRILVPAEAPSSVAGTQAAQAPVPGTVGMPRGGAPRDDAPHPASERFGAAQAREELRRRRQGGAPQVEPAPVVDGQGTDDRQGAVPQAPAQRSHGAQDADWRQPDRPGPADGSPASGAPHAPDSTGDDRRAGGTRPDVHQAEDRPGDARVGSRAPAPAPAPQDREVTPSPTAKVAARDSDMLRQRWPEVVERLSQISRVAWTLVGQNGQLGGVDGTVAVLLFPHEGMVAAFVNGRRGADVELAIHEATGLTLTVRAQVGQAGGGSPVTTPGADASRPEVPGRVDGPSATPPVRDPRQARHEAGSAGPQGRSDDRTTPARQDGHHRDASSRGERPPHASASAGAQRPTTGDVRGLSGPKARPSAPSTASAPGSTPASSGTRRASAGAVEWGPVAVPGGAAEPLPAPGGDGETDSAPAPGSGPSPAPGPLPAPGPTGPAPIGAAPTGPAPTGPAPTGPAPTGSAPTVPVVTRTAPATGGPHGTGAPAGPDRSRGGAAGRVEAPDVSAAGPVFDDDPGDDPLDDPLDGSDDGSDDPFGGPEGPGGAGWTEPVADIPGGISEPVFDDGDDEDDTGSGSRPGSDPAADDGGSTPGPVADTRRAGTATASSPGERAHAEHGRPDGRSPSDDARARPAPAVAAEMDDTASFDDADVEVATNAGLPAVLEILGGKVIEEIPDRG